MPLHSVPLFGYLSANPDLETETPGSSSVIAKDSSGRHQPLSTSAGNKEAGSSLKDPLYYDPPTYAGTSELRIFYSVVFWCGSLVVAYPKALADWPIYASIQGLL